MFSNTAYEAMYQYIGLQLHSTFIELITSQKVFMGIILLTFGIIFFITTAQFFSRYLPGALVNRHPVPFSKYIKIVALLFLGISILRVETTSFVKNYKDLSWHDNSYLTKRMNPPEPKYKVSLLFDLMSTTAEQIAATISRVIETVFRNQHANSQLDAPNLFFKAIMYASAETLDSPELKRGIKFYTDECFDRILPMIREKAQAGTLDGFFGNNSGFDRRLAELTVETSDKAPPITCLEIKNQLQTDLENYAVAKPGGFDRIDQYFKNNAGLNNSVERNLRVSSFLVNEFNNEKEGFLGVHKGSQVPGTAARVFQYLQKLGPESIASMFTDGKIQGAWVAASRAEDFSENLARAPHVAGFIKMFLIAAFPWLVFFVVAGYWRVLYVWFLMYFSVLLWTPIWTLLYHIMVGIANSAEVLEAFGKLNDGVSLYSAQLISSRMYHMYSVYSYLQLLTGTLFTMGFLYFLHPIAGDTESDSIPSNVSQNMNQGKQMGQSAINATTAVKAAEVII
ncbi:MAG: hypothetical protein AB7F43_09515 [Bacteriovoracia bacterium]